MVEERAPASVSKPRGSAGRSAFGIGESWWLSASGCGGVPDAIVCRAVLPLDRCGGGGRVEVCLSARGCSVVEERAPASVSKPLDRPGFGEEVLHIFAHTLETVGGRWENEAMTTTTEQQADRELDTPGEVLGFIRTRRADANAAEVDVLAGVTTYAEQHPPESIHAAAVWPGTTSIGGETAWCWPGQGAPLVAEFCIPELAATLGVSTESARLLIAHGLELKHRLPASAGAGHREAGAGVAGPPDRRADDGPDPGGGGVRRCPGRGVRPQDRPGRAGPAGRGGQGPVHARRRPRPTQKRRPSGVM